VPTDPRPTASCPPHAWDPTRGSGAPTGGGLVLALFRPGTGVPNPGLIRHRIVGANMGVACQRTGENLGTET